jgi:RNA polymerase sigma-70 factor (ECF subfamily)
MFEGSSQETVSDESLMARYITGDEKSFEAVYRRHRAGLRRFLARQCGSEATAQELAQEVWFRVIRAVQNKSYSADGRFAPYLYRIARNHLIDWYRKTGSYRELEMDETVSDEAEAANLEFTGIRNPEQALGDKQNLRNVLAAIEELPPEQRTALMMSLESEMSYEEIAEATGTNRETVKSRLRYARQTLRQRVLGEQT